MMTIEDFSKDAVQKKEMDNIVKDGSKHVIQMMEYMARSYAYAHKMPEGVAIGVALSVVLTAVNATVATLPLEYRHLQYNEIATFFATQGANAEALQTASEALAKAKAEPDAAQGFNEIIGVTDAISMKLS